MFRVTLIIILFFTTALSCFSQQILYYSDNFYGGATGGGYNPTFSQSTGTITVNMPTGSTIKKALLFYSATKWSNQPNFPGELPLLINGATVMLDTSYSLQNKFLETKGIPNSDADIVTLVKDISDLNSIQNQSVINVTPPPQIGFPVYWEYYILILYENNSMSKTAIDIFINDQDCKPINNYVLTPSSEMDLSKDVALALNTGAICDTIKDGSFVFVNTYPLGLIGGNEFNSPPVFCTSPSGNFYYEGNILHGLTDDTSDSLMSGTDVVANIQNYLTNSPINVKFEYQSNQGPRTNVINQLFLTYTTPCDTFSSTVTPDTTICLGETLQLNATGGQSYEWTALTDSSAIDDLSCTDCPNPVFTGNSSQVYTVRIWNNDSCSVVKPVRIAVSQPQKMSFVGSNTSCTSFTGKIQTLSDTSLYSNWFAITTNGDTLTTTSNALNNIGAGEYTVFHTNKTGCTMQDTVLRIGLQNNTVADFSVQPPSGTVPFQVDIGNLSQNATDFQWQLNGINQGSSFTGFTADKAGVYVVQLIAWSGLPECADTVERFVVAYSNGDILISEAFSPNDDAKNEVFYIEGLENFPNTKVWIYNRWGNLVFHSENYQNDWNGISQSGLNIGGSQLPEGTYYYVVELGGDLILEKDNSVKTGFVVLRR